MKISIDWLQDYVKLPRNKTPKEMAHDLTMSTVEVEQVEDLAASLRDVVVARVQSCAPHPDARSLTVVTCDHGDNELRQVVCGGSNVREGMRVALALPGAEVTGRDGEPFTIQPTELRGVASAGMLCSAGELGLSDLFPPADEKAIIDLEGWDAEPGTALAEAIGYDDVVLEIDNKSLTNRPDLWGHYGIAREFAALYDLPLTKLRPVSKIAATGDVSVTIEDEVHCPRYTATKITGVRVAPAPTWMRSRLSRVGQRPLNNIVDLTNYVMMDQGQPSHAFDLRDVASGIVVRNAHAEESITLLDGTSHALSPDTLLIADAERGLALAGVMGGEHAVRDDTQEVLLEIASFEPVQVRRTCRRYGVRTESSSRFEKGIDQARVDVALGRFQQLLSKVCEGAQMVSHLNASPQSPRGSPHLRWD